MVLACGINETIDDLFTGLFNRSGVAVLFFLEKLHTK